VEHRDTARLTAALALAASFAPSLMRRSRRDQLAVSVGAALLGGAAGAATEVLVTRLARHVGGEGTARAVLVAGGVVSLAGELSASPVSAVALAGTAARVSGMCALVGAVAPVRDAVPLEDPRTLAGVGAVGAAALVGWRQLYKRAQPPRRRLRHDPDFVPDPGSLVDADTLDFEGSRFVAGARAGAIRVFVGVRSRPTVQERCRLAVDELERRGAFARSRILVCSPTLRGYVSPIPVAAEEHLSGGDVASVAVQYFDRRTPLMPLKVPVATRTHAELLAQLRDRVPSGGPEICVYGESLGAWASQNAFRPGGVRRLDELRVARALWIGTPAFSPLPRLLARGALPSDERVGRVDARELLRDGPPAGAERLRFVFLARRTDPVVLFSGLELAWRRPEWLPERDWTPGVTFLALLADLFSATNWTSTVPQALAHDYRLEGPAAVSLAFGHGAPRERLAGLGDQLVREELDRAARLRASRGGGPRPNRGYTDRR
jgi:uncharacterized membrane protein